MLLGLKSKSKEKTRKEELVDEFMDNFTLGLIDNQYLMKKKEQREVISRDFNVIYPCYSAVEKAYKSSSVGMAMDLIHEPEKAWLHSSVESKIENIRKKVLVD